MQKLFDYLIEDKNYTLTHARGAELEQFRNLFEVMNDDEPILVVGDTGMGKSVFLEAFKYLYSQQRPGKPINEVNCSHFDGPLARSELFGHAKGSFTDAKRDHPGWIEQSDGGALILEEIGTLSPEVQAQLLTYIETGKYHRVGETKPKKARVRIIAATNDEDSLRLDFRYRFHPFYLKPFYQNRGDILRLFSVMIPGRVLADLRAWEVTTLLCHNWPGNMRELIRVFRLMALHYSRPPDIPEELQDRVLDSPFFSPDNRITGIQPASGLYAHLMHQAIEVDDLEAFLNQYNLGLSPSNDFRPFAFEQKKGWGERAEDEISRAEYGLMRFCWMFGISSDINANIVDLLKNQQDGTGSNIGIDDQAFKKLQTSIDRYIKRLSRGSQEADLTSMTFEEVQKTYFAQLLRSTETVKAAAAQAGMKDSTFRDRLKALGLHKNTE